MPTSGLCRYRHNRHTFATRLLDRGVPITYVSGQLGHADATTTLTWYAHYLPKATTRYVDLLDEDDTTSTPGTRRGVLESDGTNGINFGRA